MGNMNVEKLYNHVKTLYEAVEYGKKLCQEDKAEEVQELLKDLNVLVDMVQAMLEQDKGHLLPLAIVCCKNIRYSIEQFDSDKKNRYRIFNMEIMNMAWNLKNIVHKQYDILNNKDNARRNQSEILKRAIKMHDMVRENKKKEFKYKASIIVTAYNKLEYTKAAIESIYKYTDFSKGDVELITKNNGSTDGTQEYFESLPNKKKINYRYNAIGTSNSPDIFAGKYIVSFSNDVVATPNWLENLITCIESDDNIISVVPTCQDYAISHYQGIEVEYQNSFEDLPKMEEFALIYNKSNPCLWEERAILMPFVAVFRRELLYSDLSDPSYTQAQFIDDDISTVYRRSGWKQIVAKDTFMHHFGSVTLGDTSDVMNCNAFANMRKVYFDKWGVDAWESIGYLPYFDRIWDMCDKTSEDKVLWIDPLFCCDVLELKNIYKKENKDLVLLKAIVTNPKYKNDAEVYFPSVLVDKDIEYVLESDDESYSIITMSRYINEIVNGRLLQTLITLYNHLLHGGYLIIPIRNFSSARDICNFIFDEDTKKPYWDIECYNKVDIDELTKKIKEQIPDAKYRIAKIYNNDEIVDKLFNNISNMKPSIDGNVYDRLRMEMAWLIIQK